MTYISHTYGENSYYKLVDEKMVEERVCRSMLETSGRIFKSNIDSSYGDVLQ